MWCRTIVAVALPFVAGCTIDCLHVATGVFAGSTYGTFVVTVRDGVTGRSLVSGSTLVVRGSSWADSVTYESAPPTMTSMSLSEDQLPAGTYTVEVRHPGYQTWTYGGVSILYSSCGLATPVHLTADLTEEVASISGSNAIFLHSFQTPVPVTFLAPPAIRGRS